MTKAEIISMLAPYPIDAVVRIYDVESNRMEGVTGCVTLPTGGSGFVIDLHSDDIS